MLECMGTHWESVKMWIFGASFKDSGSEGLEPRNLCLWPRRQAILILMQVVHPPWGYSKKHSHGTSSSILLTLFCSPSTSHCQAEPSGSTWRGKPSTSKFLKSLSQVNNTQNLAPLSQIQLSSPQIQSLILPLQSVFQMRKRERELGISFSLGRSQSPL